MRRIIYPVMLFLCSMSLLPYEMKSYAAIFFASLCPFLFRYCNDRVYDGNRWLYLLLAYIPLSILLSPKISMMAWKYDLGGLWMWEAFAWCIGSFLIYHLVLSIDMKREKHRSYIGLSVAIPAVLSSVYAILQAAGIDQFQQTRPAIEIGTPANAGVTAIIGNPTFLAIYLAYCIPFVAMYIRKWWITCIVVVAMFMCGSDTAVMSIVVAYGVFFHAKLPKIRSVILAIGILSFIGVVLFLMFHPSHFNGRVHVWHMAMSDVLNGVNGKMFAITGRGIGSFQMFFPLDHNTTHPVWNTAHNEWIESAYSIGLVGVSIMAMALLYVVRKSYNVVAGLCNDKLYSCFFISSLVIITASFTLPVWHQEPSRMLFVVAVAYLSRKS